MAKPKPDVHEPDRGPRPSPYLRATVVLGVDELSALQREALEEVTARPGWVVESVDEGWGPGELARSAAEAGAELLVAAGGDGTVSAVAAALAELRLGGDADLPPMAVLPLGTANDFARTLAVHELNEALEALRAARRRSLDMVRVGFGDGSQRWVLNVANGGLAWDIADTLDAETKSAWGSLAYARGALEVVGSPNVHEVSVQVDDALPEPFRALTVAVSSGRSCGGGLRLAPTADPEDGLLEVTILQEAPPAAVARLAARMRLGPVEVDEALARFRGRHVKLETEPPMGFVLDGELVPGKPVEFTLVPGAVDVLVGPEYDREPAIDRAS